MAPPPEYDKEPKAPDKSTSTVSCDDSTEDLLKDQHVNADNRVINTGATVDVENNAHVESLDDGQLRALLDEAINYKSPKDREGKSVLFQELLQEAVEKDEAACEAGVRGARSTRRAGGGALSASMQDLVAAALAAEPAHHSRRRHHHTTVSARAIHGGSLPSGVDTTFLASEDPPIRGGKEYVATVQCVNPSPHFERRVSISDAHNQQEMEQLNRGKPAFPMTYTSCATLEIGSRSVCSGRAVTTTTASNQVRTPPSTLSRSNQRFHQNRPLTHPQVPLRRVSLADEGSYRIPPTCGPPERIFNKKMLYVPNERPNKDQMKLMSALNPKNDRTEENNGGGKKKAVRKKKRSCKGDVTVPRGPQESNDNFTVQESFSYNKPDILVEKADKYLPVSVQRNQNTDGLDSSGWINNIDNWYKGLAAYTYPLDSVINENANSINMYQYKEPNNLNTDQHQLFNKNRKSVSSSESISSISYIDIASGSSINCLVDSSNTSLGTSQHDTPFNKNRIPRELKHNKGKRHSWNENVSNLQNEGNIRNIKRDNKSDTRLEKKPGCRLASLSCTSSVNPKNIRSMSVAKPIVNIVNSRTDQANPVKRDKNTDCMIVSESKKKTNYKNKTIVKNINNNTSEIIQVLNANETKGSESNHVKTTHNNINIHIDGDCDKKCDISRIENKDNCKPSIPKKMSVVNSDIKSGTIDTIKTDNKLLKHVKTDKVLNELELCVENKICETLIETISTTPKQRDVRDDKAPEEIINCVNTISPNLNNESYCVIEIPEEVLEHGNRKLQNIDISLEFEASSIGTKDIEMENFTPMKRKDKNNSFSQYFAEQQKLLRSLEDPGALESTNEITLENRARIEEVKDCKLEYSKSSKEPVSVQPVTEDDQPEKAESLTNTETEFEYCETIQSNDLEDIEAAFCQSVNQGIDKKFTEPYIFAKLPNNSYVFLTLPPNRLRTTGTVQDDIKNNNDVKSLKNTTLDKNTVSKATKKKDKKAMVPFGGDGKKMDKINKNTLKVLLFENMSRGDAKSKSVSVKPGVSAVTNEEVDSAISFSCITTPEVVASCNTTSSTSQSAVTVDAKPLQLGSCYRAVTSLTGAAPAWVQRAAAAHQSSPPGNSATKLDQPRSVITSSINGLPLGRASYGATASTASEESKKSLDENGNSLQGFSSPLSGSSQHKKPRRKKSSKNETVINSHQIDGYQGNKDLNELLRFIEADNGRGHKLTRSKHKDDSEDKTGKKRSTERRKDKESKMKRATSMEELSRTKLEDLTDKPELSLRNNKKERWTEGSGSVKAERRSWGDDSRDTFFYREREPAESAPEAGGESLEMTEFQTVTKKRKPRKRAEDSEREAASGDPPRRQRAPSPRSNDSNDDMDSVHSLSADASQTRANAQQAAHASYADIARTRHNIPDLIESCNFYTEGESSDTRVVPPQNEEPSPPAPDSEYPALETRTVIPTRRRDGKKRKEREIAPDVVADRRPVVILLDSGNVSRDMDGVTFGFDINEQLVGCGRRGRVDLLRDAPDAVPVVAGCAALRYLPPKLMPHSQHLHQIIDYVGNAWEDIVRSGGGKVRYYSE